jgi:hypothetical protein
MRPDNDRRCRIAGTSLTLALFSCTFGRLFFRKDTGRKLAHFDRLLNAGRAPMPPHFHREELN